MAAKHPVVRTPKQLDELAGHLDVGRGYGADDALVRLFASTPEDLPGEVGQSQHSAPAPGLG